MSGESGNLTMRIGKIVPSPARLYLEYLKHGSMDHMGKVRQFDFDILLANLMWNPGSVSQTILQKQKGKV